MNRRNPSVCPAPALDSAAESRRGPAKQHNDDALLLDPERGWFAVADGVSSCREPAQASQQAIEVLRQQLQNPPATADQDLGPERLLDIFQACNDALYSPGEEITRQWLTTLLVGAVGNSRLALAHCGDSRAYLWQHGKLALLTHDHTLVGDLVQAGVMRMDEVSDHPHRNLLSSCLGMHRRARIEQQSLALDPPWVLLLCSDGVSNSLSPTDIHDHLAADATAAQIAVTLLDTTTRKGTQDDATVVVVRRPF